MTKDDFDYVLTRIKGLAEQVSNHEHYINQLESKIASLENDIYSLQTTVNRLEGV